MTPGSHGTRKLFHEKYQEQKSLKAVPMFVNGPPFKPSNQPRRGLEDFLSLTEIGNDYLRPADSVKAGGYFFYAGKTLIGAIQGIFQGD